MSNCSIFDQNHLRVTFVDKIIRAHQCPSVGIDNFVLISVSSRTNNPCQSAKSVVKTSFLFFLHLIINSRIFFLNLRVIIKMNNWLCAMGVGRIIIPKLKANSQ